MIAKILIKRRFKKGHQKQVFALLNELRTRAMAQPGYISGETLTKSSFPNNTVVIATWQSMQAWHAWKEAKDRRKFEAMLEMYQERPTEYDEYYLGLYTTDDQTESETMEASPIISDYSF